MASRSKKLLMACLGLGVSLGLTSAVGADGWFHKRSAPCPCPPGHVVPYQPAPTLVTPPGTTPTTPPAAPGTTPTTPPATPDAAATTPTDLSAGLESTAAVTQTVNIAGRADQTNRFNLFDTMSAVPKSKVWFGYQSVGGYKTGLNPNSALSNALSSSLGSSVIPGSGFSPSSALSSAGFNPDLLNRVDTTLYRFGVEYACSDKFSVAFQTQYVTADVDGSPDAWANPQFLFKYVVSQSETCVVSAILGIQPQTSARAGEFSDDTTSYYPGMLFYSGQGDMVLQGGWQVRIPVGGNNVYTLDYAISAGYWLYRHPSITYAGNHGGCCGSGGKAWLLGIVPQIELFGKHVIGDATVDDPFDFPSSTSTTIPTVSPGLDGIFGTADDVFSTASLSLSTPFTYEEPRHVFDLTIGTQVIFGHGVSVAAGYSFPLSGGSVRDDEWLFSITFGF